MNNIVYYILPIVACYLLYMGRNFYLNSRNPHRKKWIDILCEIEDEYYERLKKENEE